MTRPRIVGALGIAALTAALACPRAVRAADDDDDPIAQLRRNQQSPAPAAPADDPAALQRASAASQRLQEAVRSRAGRDEIRAARAAVLAAADAFGPKSTTGARLLNNNAEACRQQGEYESAEELLTRAAAIHERVLGEVPDLAINLSNLADLYKQMGQYARGEPLARRALEIFERRLGPTHSYTATALNNLAELYKEWGELAKAQPLYERALRIRRAEGETANLGKVLKNLGDAHRLRGDTTGAKALYEEAIAVFQRTLGADHYLVGVAYGELALALAAAARPLPPDARGKVLERALEHARRSLAVAEKSLGPNHPDLAKHLAQVGAVQMDARDCQGALQTFERASALAEATLGGAHPFVAVSHANAGAAASCLGQHARAATLYQSAVTLLDRTAGPRSHATSVILSNLALARIASGDARRAIPDADRAADIVDGALAGALALGSEQEKLRFMRTVEGGIDRALSLHLREVPSDETAARLALRTLVRRKGRVAEAMGDAMAAVRGRLGDEDAKRLDQLAWLRSAASDPILVLLNRFNGMEVQQTADRLEGELMQRSADLRSLAAPVSLDDVRRTVPRGHALVEIAFYFPHDARKTRDDTDGYDIQHPRYAAYTLSSGGAVAGLDLGEAGPIDQLAREYRRALAARSDGALALARQLHARVLAPIRARVGPATSLIVSPDGDLGLVPLESFVDDAGRYALETIDVTYVTSARDLVRLGARAPKPPGPTVVFAGVDFDGARKRARLGALGNVHFDPLPGTLAEGKGIAAALPGVELRTGAQASEAALKALHGPAVLHIATHGFFLGEHDTRAERTRGLVFEGKAGLRPEAPRATELPENPLLRSGLALAAANTGGDDERSDGILTAAEAAMLDLRGTRLVVLSACETGLGKIEPREGVFGLRRALVIAGAESQVMSLWKVDDDATRDLMIAFHQAIAAGGGRADALRKARLELLRRPPTRHPYFWAAFVFAGDWRPLAGGPIEADGAADPRGPSASRPVDPRAARAGTEAPVAPSRRGPSPVGYVLVGAGAVSLGVAAVLGALTASASASLGDGCPKRVCPPSRASDLDDAKTLANAATVAVGLGVGSLVIGGVVLLATRAPRAAARPAVTPWIGLGSAGLRGSF